MIKTKVHITYSISISFYCKVLKKEDIFLSNACTFNISIFLYLSFYKEWMKNTSLRMHNDLIKHLSFARDLSLPKSKSYEYISVINIYY